MDVRVIEAAGVRRHSVHSPAEEAPHLPALVPPHHRPTVHLVLFHGVHVLGTLVCRHELLCP